MTKVALTTSVINELANCFSLDFPVCYGLINFLLYKMKGTNETLQ